ncbi:hypothetical protein AUK40_02585 [Candidatus Wirthbacteria bacterium CG2_30_54_11]|uniref:Uncharacterized protein n=1 Tax=Candidatus Wirthbacteria bacterium CG2_30_54_11 TaxID=1817892 RepID=A0A1J5IX43_9BACT|nr:MAG: hypothetical protein AUK40_02585 [Candidatus Wirthbacteria bacterium CG2_30_54_11]
MTDSRPETIEPIVEEPAINPVSPVLSSELDPDAKKTEKTKKFTLIVTLLCAILLMLITGAYLIFGKKINAAWNVLISNDHAVAEEDTYISLDPPVEELPPPVSIPTTPVVEPPASFPVLPPAVDVTGSLPFFFQKDGALWMQDMNGTETLLLSTMAPDEAYAYDQSHLGYDICDARSGTWQCSVKSLNWKTATETTLWSSEPTQLISLVAFFDQDTWAVGVLSPNSEGVSRERKTYLHEGTTISYLFSKTGRDLDCDSLGWGDGGRSLTFSSDASYLLETEDNCISVYDMAGTQMTKIPGANQPVWINDTQILYRDAFGDKAALWTVPTSTRSVIDAIPSDAHRFTINPDGDRVAFFTYQGIGEVWMYNIPAGTAIRVGEGMIDGSWTFDADVVGQLTDTCQPDDCHEPGQTISNTGRSIRINSESKTVTQLDFDSSAYPIKILYSIWK